jgi:hypothetical protein
MPAASATWQTPHAATVVHTLPFCAGTQLPELQLAPVVHGAPSGSFWTQPPLASQ